MEKYIKELIEQLNKAADAYYMGIPIMSDREYDTLFDKLSALEQETGLIFPDSPTQKVGGNVSVSEREKIPHEFPARSLDKTKDRDALVKWLGDKKGVLSWKMDGLTLQLTYEKGRLIRALTRGNGIVGENIMDAVPYISGIPSSIGYTGKLVVRGEGVMSYEEFERVNSLLDNPDEKYKNPRNLAAGTIRALDIQVHKSRKLSFFAFRLVYADDITLNDASFTEQMQFLKNNNFGCVGYIPCTSENLKVLIENCEKGIGKNHFPTDGLVLTYEDTVYGRMLGSTGHHPKHSMAFKWKDDCMETPLKYVEWSPSKTGLLNPVAVFEPVEIEGTTVSRASIHNVSIFESLELGAGDILSVYKANMIIPQVAENQTRSNTLMVPKFCPVCNHETAIRESRDDVSGDVVKTLFCVNPDCRCKMIGKLDYFTTRNAANIEGISEATINLLYDAGFLRKLSDFYSLKDHAEEMKKLDGMGDVAVANLLASIEKSKNIDLAHFVTALSIPLVGNDTASLISDFCNGDPAEFYSVISTCPETLLKKKGIGKTIVDSLKNWWKQTDKEEFSKLSSCFTFEKAVKGTKLAGLTFVVTGSVNHFTNRDELCAFIAENGGKTAGSVSKNTSYLINNDITSTSGKNKKAKELDIPVISEEDFLKMV